MLTDRGPAVHMGLLTVPSTAVQPNMVERPHAGQSLKVQPGPVVPTPHLGDSRFDATPLLGTVITTGTGRLGPTTLDTGTTTGTGRGHPVSTTTDNAATTWTHGTAATKGTSCPFLTTVATTGTGRPGPTTLGIVATAQDPGTTPPTETGQDCEEMHSPV